MMLEAGQPEARALAYIAEAKKMVPNKPIRYVMNTHAHADHTGGLPAFVAEGATIITHRNNETFLEKALNTPRTLLDDTLARSEEGEDETVSDRRPIPTAGGPCLLPRLARPAYERHDGGAHPAGEGPLPG